MALPGNVNTITVTGTYLDFQGYPQTGSLTFTPNAGPFDDSATPAILTGIPVSAKLSTAGAFSVVLPCTDNTSLSPTGFSYAVGEALSGGSRTYFIQVPRTLGPTVDLATLVPVSPAPAVSTVYGVLANTNVWTGVSNIFQGVTVQSGLSVVGPVSYLGKAPGAYEQGYLAWSLDSAAASSQASAATGVQQMIRVEVGAATTVTYVSLHLAALGVTLTAAENFVGLYNSSGVLLSGSADQTSSWNTGGSTGLKRIPLTSAQSIPAGVYYVAILTNGTTGPQFACAPAVPAALLNAGLTAATCRWGALSGAGTLLPSTLSMGGLTLAGAPLWTALS